MQNTFRNAEMCGSHSASIDVASRVYVLATHLVARCSYQIGIRVQPFAWHDRTGIMRCKCTVYSADILI